MSSLCHMDLQNLLLGEVLFFFSGLMTGPTYRPLVRHSNADTPLLVLALVLIGFTQCVL